MADLNERRYTAEAMVLAARDAGLIATHRLLRDWVQRGLVDQPKKAGLGQGLGSEATYSENQMRLWISLLGQRLRGAKVANLYNLPVWLWLRFGDDHVPLRQVRRALARWGRQVTGRAWGPAEQGAGRVARNVAGQGARRQARKRLRQMLAELSYGLDVDWADLLDAAREVIDPDHTGQPRGPAGAELTPEGYVEMVRFRIAAMRNLRSIDDETFETARRVYRKARSDYATEFGGFSRDPDLGHLFEVPTAESEINAAANDLVTILGLLSKKATR